ncbi:MAG TPA: carboxymuconolactone decarboxylase family protein [Candidatus Dormibacteraeota bacterium]|nr:carboxymuconolactone decarboxylase family protein [Candidatus Dormibacteraeota bacterium]
MTDHGQVLKDLGPPISELRQAIPEVWSGYTQTHRAVMVDGALSAKHKELIALAISVVKKCDGCVAAHARGAARRGATPQEVAEAIGVTLLLDGGPATVWGPRAWEAYQQFAATSDGDSSVGQPR